MCTACALSIIFEHKSPYFERKIYAIKEPPNPGNTRLDGSKADICYICVFLGSVGSSPTAGIVKTSIFSGFFLFQCAFCVHNPYYIANFFSKWLFNFLVKAASYSLITPR